MSFIEFNKESVEVFAICYNEEYMLPFFIEHYKKNFGASITIFDNNSTDNSQQIIKSLGCNLKTYDSGNQIRDDYYLNIKNNCWKGSKADWVIVCDIDEFLELDFDVSRYTMINTKGFDVVGLPDSRVGVQNPMFSKHIMFKPLQLQAINYRPGCHTCQPVGVIKPSKEIANLLHRKYISVDYVYNRHVMYESRMSDFNKKYEFGKEYLQVTKESIFTKFEEMSFIMDYIK